MDTTLPWGESSEEFRQRLRRDNLMKPYQKLKKQLKADHPDWPAGKVWQEAVKEFPPGTAEGEPEPPKKTRTRKKSAPVDRGAFSEDVLSGNVTQDIRRDAQWVYDYLEIKNAKPKDAPSQGAWSMLMWARQNETNKTKFFDFLRQVAPKEEAGRELRDDGRKLSHIDTLLQGAEGSGEQPATA